jgi:hypothetical protein
MFVLLIGELQTMFLLIHFKGNSWCLMVPAMEGKKGAVPPLDQWKLNAENQNRNKNISVSFLHFFLLHISRDLHPRINALNLS